jgi:hypothetical protein
MKDALGKIEQLERSEKKKNRQIKRKTIPVGNGKT